MKPDEKGVSRWFPIAGPKVAYAWPLHKNVGLPSIRHP